MTLIESEIEKLYGFCPSDTTLFKLEKWRELFLNYNSHTNLMSKNDLALLYEKHVADSLSITLFDGFKNGITLLDVGAGGGFPCLIIALFFPEIKVIGLDSIKKKTDFLSFAKKELSLINFEVINARAENILPLGADILTNRAVGKISDVWRFSSKHLKKGGFFVSYKSVQGQSEAEIAAQKHKELCNLKTISYNLPLSENYTRELIIFQKQ